MPSCEFAAFFRVSAFLWYRNLGYFIMSSQAAATFHPFQRLPQELRLQIWQWSLPRRRCLQMLSVLEGYTTFLSPENLEPSIALETVTLQNLRDNKEVPLRSLDPVLLNVNREARAVTTRHYTFCPRLLSNASDANFVDFNIDLMQTTAKDLKYTFRKIGPMQMYTYSDWEQRDWAVKQELRKMRSLWLTGYIGYGYVDRYFEQILSQLPPMVVLRELHIMVSRYRGRTAHFQLRSLDGIKRGRSLQMDGAKKSEKDRPFEQVEVQILDLRGRDIKDFRYVEED